MKIYIASDHAGFDLKETLKPLLERLGHEVEDVGVHKLDADDDYPDFIRPAAKLVASEPGSRGIVIGGSGQGEAIVANRIKGIRAAVIYSYNEDIIKLSREHNDANVLSLGARVLTESEAERAVKIWLETPFSGIERHARRNKKTDG